MKKMNCLIIPFHNEELRFEMSQLANLLDVAALKVLMVNDSSDDMLSQKIEKQFKSNNRLRIINTLQRSGKAEAIRFGLRSLSLDDFNFIGFTDADFSTPASEILNAFDLASLARVDVLHATRIESNDNFIETTTFRKRQGWMFQLLVSKILKLQSRDTQCGLKVYTAALLSELDLETPFHDPWLFDLELLLRIPDKASCRAMEYSLNRWIHKRQSKVRLESTIFVPINLLKLRFMYGTLREFNLMNRKIVLETKNV